MRLCISLPLRLHCTTFWNHFMMRTKMKQRLVSNIDRVHLWNTMNVVYDMRIKDAKAKKRIKKMGFRAWLGALPRVQLEEIGSRLAGYRY